MYRKFTSSAAHGHVSLSCWQWNSPVILWKLQCGAFLAKMVQTCYNVQDVVLKAFAMLGLRFVVRGLYHGLLHPWVDVLAQDLTVQLDGLAVAMH